MNIVHVEHLLANHNDGADPLQMMRLVALEPRRDPYFALLCQPDGTIHASAQRIGNANQQAARPMYRAFLDRAVSSQAQLAATPEYSVPWALIGDIAFGATRPPEGAIWVLGFESTTPVELDALRLAFGGHPGLRLIHEPFDPQQRAQKVFVDPLVFVFWARDSANLPVLCFLIQFKTVVSRDPDHVELTSLYIGSDVYRFSAHAGDIALIGLICSDAFEFTDALVDEYHHDALIVHVQLNQRPGHADYAAYRTRLFSVATNSNVEVVCLNWSNNVVIDGVAGTWNSIAGSAWYVGPRNLAVSDNDVNTLHRDGVYYSVVGHRWHGFYFDYAAHALLLRKQPVFSTGPQALVQRVSPAVVERTVWYSQQAAWIPGAADDGFGAFIQPYVSLPAILTPLCDQDPLAVERALELLEGPGGNVRDWYTLKELQALKVADEESIRRVTVSQETDQQRLGVAFRRQRARRAQTAATISAQPATWPPPLLDLAAGFRYRWTQPEPHCNIEPANGGRPAALVYLGEDPEPDTLSNVHAKLVKARKVHGFAAAVEAGTDPNDAVSQAEDRLAIAYRRNGALEFYRPPAYASITDPAGTAVDDIAGEEQ